MANGDGGTTSAGRASYVLALVNVGVWAISMIALILLMQRFPGARRMYPILGGGTAVGIALVAVIRKR